MHICIFYLRPYTKYFIILLLVIALLIGIGAFSPRIATVWSQSRGRDIPIYSVECNGKKASITFDCAWGAEDIPKILDILKNENVKATFFIVGQWAEKFPEKVKMIANDGHDIGNHSYSHLRMGALDREKIKSEISLGGTKLSTISGRKVELFRPPYGDYSNNVVSVARSLGYYTIQWNVDSLDWKPGISRDYILSRVVTGIKPGSIILFHNDTPHTVAILPDIIKSLKKGGYEFLPVSQLIIRDNYEIDFEGRQRRKE
ncbi:MAG: polysaccharide deacetylase family protein [Acetivibrionales bacterium]|jgi:polysaccharide deacetylase family sporulation protein PdaB